MEQTERIEKMEQKLNKAREAIARLRQALSDYSGAQADIAELIAYYGGEWMQDYNDDAAGLLPCGLKRGVLSEDGIFDLMSDNRAVLEEMTVLAEKISGELQ